MNGQLKHKEKQVIKELAVLLRSNGDRILSGESKLCLTTVSLTLLNTGFQDVQSDECQQSFEVVKSSLPGQLTPDDLLFLYDFVQKTISLKIIHTSSTLQGRVSISDFRGLRILEIKKVPIHLVQGLSKHRLKLRTVICSRTLQNLQDLFESCGGDMSSAMSWTDVRVACLSYNFLQSLDSSLRLLPKLEVIDLSHNAITSTEAYLEYLTEVSHVNLSFNLLETMPTFSMSSRLKLKTLLLKGNDLDNLSGLEELSSLEELDVSCNCLTGHAVLQPLCTLNQLRLLFLDDNPLAFHENHRLLTIQYVSSIAVPKLVLDGKQVSRSELVYQSGRSSRVASVNGPDRMPRTSSVSSATNISSGFRFEHSGEIATSLRTRKKKKSKSVRRKLVTDLGSDATPSSRDSSRASSPPPSLDLPDAEETRKQLEQARHQQKEYWLQAINVHKNTNLLDVSVETEDDIYLNEKERFMDSSEAEKVELMKAEAQVHRESDDSTMIRTASTNSETVTMTTDVDAVVTVTGATTDTMTTEKGSGTKTKGSETIEERVVTMETEETEDNVDELEKIFVTRKEGDLWKTMNKKLSDMDNNDEDVSDPFIVMIPEDKNKQMIITVGKRFIHEKNIECIPQDMLDLSCLLVATTSEKKVVTENTIVSVRMPVIHLQFDYVKKDRRERSYIMEDRENMERFFALIQPALEAKSLTDSLKDRVQCLKCSREFNKSQAAVNILEMSISTAKKKSSSLPRKYAGSKGDLEEQILCPFCKSSMVVVVEDSITRARSPNSNSPLGSVSSMSSLTPLATSSVVSTPVKKLDKAEGHSRGLKVTHQRVAAKSAYDTSSQDSSDDLVLPAVGPRRDSFYRARSPAFLGTRDAGSPTQKLSDDSDISLLDSPRRSPDSVAEHKKQRSRSGSASSRGSKSGRSSRKNSLQSSASHQTARDSSLTTSTCSDMVRSVYENSISSSSSSHSLHNKSSQRTTYRSVIEPDSPSASKTHKPAQRSGYQSVIKPDQSLADSQVDSANQPFKSSVLFSIGTPGNEIDHCDNDLLSFKSFEEQEHPFESSVEVTASPRVTPYLQETINRLAEEEELKNAADELKTATSVQDEPGKLKFSYDDFTSVDHRLKLHLVMNLFEEEEDVQLVLKSGVVQYMKADEFVGVLIISTKKIYVLKLTGPESDMNLEDWLKCIDILPITDLRYIDIGFHCQCFRLEFDLEFSCYSFLVRDDERCQKFVQKLSAIARNMAFHSDVESKLQGIHQVNNMTLLNLQTQVLHTPTNGNIVEDVDSQVICYCMGYLKTSEVDKNGAPLMSAITVIVTASDMCLASENHQWPLPRLQSPPSDDLLRTQFELKDRQKISNIAQLERFPESPLQVGIDFFNEDTSEDCSWVIDFTTRRTVTKFIDSIKEPWQKLFGVELTIL